MSEENRLIPVLLLVVPLLFMGVVVVPNIASFGAGGISVENPWYVNTTGCNPCGDGSTGAFEVAYHDSSDIERVPCPRDKWVDEPGEYLSPNATCYEMPDGSIAIGGTGE